MKEATTLPTMAKCWTHKPELAIRGAADPGISAALWTHNPGRPQEVEAEPDPSHHVLSVQLAAPRTDVAVDGRVVFNGVVPRYSSQLMIAGSRPGAVFYEDHSTLHIYIPTSVVDQAILAAELTNPTQVELTDPRCTRDPAFERIAREILVEMRELQPTSRLRVDALGQELVIQLLRRHSNLAGTSPITRAISQGGLAPYRLRRVQALLRDRLADDLGLEDLAREAGLSPFHFARAFKQETGTSPHRYLLERRIDHAKELLVGTDQSIEQVAKACGFATQAGFTAAFRRVAATTPGRWRHDR